MAFAVLRTAKIKTAGNAGGLSAHLERKRETLNADPELSKYNYRAVGSGDLVADIQQRIEQAGCKVRKNAVLAVEHVMTASPEHFNFNKKYNEKGEAELWGNQDNWKQFEKNCADWLIKRYGKENIVNVTVHKDEQTPHIHAIVVPIDERGKLNASKWFDGRQKMSQMQTSFAEVHKAQGLERGIEGSKAKYQDVKRFYGILNEVTQTAEIKIEPLQVEIKAPEKEKILGVEVGYKQDPGQLAAMEAQRINKLLKEDAREKQAKATKDVETMQTQAKQGKVLENRNRGLERTVKGLQGQLEKEKHQRTVEVGQERDKRGKLVDLIKDIAEGKIKPDQVKTILRKFEEKRSQGWGMGMGM